MHNQLRPRKRKGRHGLVGDVGVIATVMDDSRGIVASMHVETVVSAVSVHVPDVKQTLQPNRAVVLVRYLEQPMGT